MTSIAAIPANTYQSPLQRLQDELQSQVSAGTVSASDQAAISSALTDIDSSMQQGRASDQASGTRPSPSDMKSKIDDLIENEVSSGKLTGDQAAELKGVFEAAFANGPGGPNGAGAPQGGPPPGPPPSVDATSSGGAGATESTGNSGSSGSSSADDLLKEFLQLLQNSLSSSSTSYGATGGLESGSSGSSIAALLIDYKS